MNRTGNGKDSGVRALTLQAGRSGGSLHCSQGGIRLGVAAGCSSSSALLTCCDVCSLQETRLKEGIVRLQPQEEPLRSELLSGKFTVLVRARR